MKTLASLLIAFALTLSGEAQDYVGVYEQVPPHGLAGDAGWARTLQYRLQIRPDRITWTIGRLKPEPSKIPLTKEGSFLLAKEEKPGGTMFHPIYVFDRNTVFTMGMKFVRAQNQTDIEEEKR